MSFNPGSVTFVGAGPGDPELLTLKALRAIQGADVVVHDRLISPEILALIPAAARRIDAGKEGFGPSTPQAQIDATLVAEARAGARVVRLKAGDSGVFGRLDEEIEALEAAGLAYDIVPGITSAAAAVAAIGQSFTRRGRNSGVRLVTGHDAKGFADHDWRALARPGEVAAIYMGKRAARFLAGRLLMHGAAPDTPVTAVENASRPDQRILATTLARLPAALDEAALVGPAILLFGLAPRAAEAVLPAVAEEFA
ncbi:MAG: uroporphyrinogen-III C-methyltransferase [Rhodobacteraceae bacterium]|jgi:uroporphyrin-III C-methyltransferase|nr:uroporphyrinogen-III C-methyltransferase [Paracoccaceae bacterium]